MLSTRWPLLVLLLTDLLAAGPLVYLWAQVTTTSGLTAAYLVLLMLAVQVPLCVVGFRAASKHSMRHLARVYVVHGLLTVTVFVLAESGAPMCVFHLLRFA